MPEPQRPPPPKNNGIDSDPFAEENAFNGTPTSAEPAAGFADFSEFQVQFPFMILE
jgi:hypothetical protein